VLAGYAGALALHWLLHLPGIVLLLGQWGVAAGRGALHDEIHWALALAGALLLAVLGINLALGYLRRRGTSVAVPPGRYGLAALALLVNLDAFSAGLGMGMLQDVPVPLAVVAMVSVGVLVAATGLN